MPAVRLLSHSLSALAALEANVGGCSAAAARSLAAMVCSARSVRSSWTARISFMRWPAVAMPSFGSISSLRSASCS